MRLHLYNDVCESCAMCICVLVGECLGRGVNAAAL